MRISLARQQCMQRLTPILLHLLLIVTTVSHPLETSESLFPAPFPGACWSLVLRGGGAKYKGKMKQERKEKYGLIKANRKEQVMKVDLDKLMAQLNGERVEGNPVRPPISCPHHKLCQGITQMGSHSNSHYVAYQ